MSRIKVVNRENVNSDVVASVGRATIGEWNGHLPVHRNSLYVKSYNKFFFEKYVIIKKIMYLILEMLHRYLHSFTCKYLCYIFKIIYVYFM